MYAVTSDFLHTTSSFPSPGIASSKKLARRHAAENLLVVMEEEGMNFNPDLLEMRTKVGLCSMHTRAVTNYC